MKAKGESLVGAASHLYVPPCFFPGEYLNEIETLKSLQRNLLSVSFKTSHCSVYKIILHFRFSSFVWDRWKKITPFLISLPVLYITECQIHTGSKAFKRNYKELQILPSPYFTLELPGLPISIIHMALKFWGFYWNVFSSHCSLFPLLATISLYIFIATVSKGTELTSKRKRLWSLSKECLAVAGLKKQTQGRKK